MGDAEWVTAGTRELYVSVSGWSLGMVNGVSSNC